MADRAPALPSLHALHVFEAAARHLGFTLAGKELGVTQTAVSHQIKSLEADLGGPLFRRSSRGLTLTALGQAWFGELRPVFSRLRDANGRLRRQSTRDRPVVALSTIPSFGSRWLVPRLGRFFERCPDIEVRISATQALTDFDVEPIDVVIRYGRGGYAGLFSEELARDDWVVVAAPSLLARGRLRSSADLDRFTLLYDDDLDGWAEWHAAHGEALPAGARYTQLTDSSMLVEAAVRGQGVALARHSLAADELERGTLAPVFPEARRVPTGRAYHLVGPKENFRRPEIAAFREWIVAETSVLRRRGPPQRRRAGRAAPRP